MKDLLAGLLLVIVFATFAAAALFLLYGFAVSFT